MTRTKKAILATIASIATASTKLQQRIHDVAIECLEHAQQHGDATLFQQLYLKLPNGQRREALIEWGHTFSPVRIRSKGERCGILKESAKGYTPWNLEEAANAPYWTMDERTMFKVDLASMDFEAIVNAALKSKAKKLETAIEKANDESDPYTGDVEALQAALDKLGQDATERGFSLAMN